jgi:sulfopropanediol 3-dehydrogenase
MTGVETTTASEMRPPAGKAAGADAAVRDVVTQIVEDIREGGDAAVREHSQRLDHWAPESFRLSDDEIQACLDVVPAEAIADIRQVQDNVRRFAQAQRESITDVEFEISPGVVLGHRNIPIERVAVYVPGGRYPMVASATMGIVTAKVAGVPYVAACTPPTSGKVAPETIAAMHLAGADAIYALGGVQAIAALALGTEDIPAVDFIVGPGNAYVAEAKRMLFGTVGIDLVAGPTEVLVIADDAADPQIVAADLLGQAEHGPTTPAVLITTSDALRVAVEAEITRQLETLPTADIASVAWRDHGEIHVVEDLEAALALGEEYASEHVEILTRDPRWFLEHMRNYGALFLGEGTTVAYGDKAIGTNHVLPTQKGARYTGGLWVGKFLKTCTYQEVTPEASIAVGELSARQSRLENFEGHARSCDVRVAKFRSALEA